MKKKISEKIILIEKELRLNAPENKLSLFSGLGGYPVFYYLLYELTKEEKYLREIQKYLEKIFEIINNNDEYSFSYCDGLTGIAFMFNFLLKKNILPKQTQIDVKEALSFIDVTLIDYALKNTKDFKDIDFLHGAFGAAYYLNERVLNLSKKDSSKKLISFYEKLATITIAEVKKSKNMKNLTIKEIDDKTHRTNCGLAHGHVSYIIIFIKFLANFPENKLVKEAVKQSTECLMSFMSDDENSFCQFPSIAVNKLTASYNSIPLGWCYGDQTISFALIKASEFLSDKKLAKVSHYLAEKNLSRDSINKIFSIPFYDSGFCHGLSSIAYLHKKWSLISNNEEFKVQYYNFILKLLENGNQSDKSISGYQKHIGNNVFKNEVGFLTGSLGIGVVLIDYLLDINNTEWDSFFLLN